MSSHDGEEDTPGPSDFSGNPSGAKMEDVGEGEEDDVDEEPVDVVIPSIRGAKRRGDGELKQSRSNDLMNTDHPTIAQPRLRASSDVLSSPSAAFASITAVDVDVPAPPPSATPASHLKRPLGPMHPQQSKKPRLEIVPSPGLAHSHSSSDDPMPSAGSPVSGSRSGQYSHNSDVLSRNYGVSGYNMPHQSTHGHPHSFSSASHQNHQRHQHPHLKPTSHPLPVLEVPATAAAAMSFPHVKQQARVSLALRSSSSSGAAASFGLDWPVHVPPAVSGPGGDMPPSKPGSRSGSGREGDRERDGGSAGSGASAGPGGIGPGGGGGNGTDWLDFLSGANNGAATG
ncbi:hypothetical protein D9615_010244 [Tricholomella constricta]|uniref:Uncharacterized protein n=1 Tax=Tricholomella constricta TaxID=117010 RepID=A0A8H5LTP0_9AGAR|nr:hypothetical protein D9615_010244 [Tricholomella constricta]